MLFITTVILIIIFICQLVKSYKNSIFLISPGFIFSVLWLLIITLYCFRAYNIKSASVLAQTIIFVGILGMEFGVICGRHCTVGKSINRSTKDYDISKKTYFVFSVVLFIVLVVTTVNSIVLLASGVSLGQVRYLERGDVLRFPIVDIMYNYYAVPMGYLLIHVNINKLFVEHKKALYLFSTIFIVIGSILTEGGRFIIYFVAADALVLLLYYSSNNMIRVSTKAKRIAWIGILLCVVGFVYITKDRGSDVYKTIYIYLCGCIPFLSNKVEMFESSFAHTYGFTSLNGFIRPVFIILEKVGLGIPDIILRVEDILLDVELNTYNIANNIVYNGFVTMFYSFYVDIGVVGVFLGSFIFGVFSGSVYRKLIINANERLLILYLLFVQYIIMSMMRFFGTSFNFALCLVYLIILYRPHDVEEIYELNNME